MSDAWTILIFCVVGAILVVVPLTLILVRDYRRGRHRRPFWEE